MISLKVKHPGYLLASAALIGAGGLLLASQLIPAALVSIGTGLVVGSKKGISFSTKEAEKVLKQTVKLTAPVAKRKALHKKSKKKK